MSGRSEEHQEQERPRPVRFSIFGQIQQQQQVAMAQASHLHRNGGTFGDLHHHVSIKAENGDYNEDRYPHDDDEEEELDEEHQESGDQPLDFSAKKSEPKITAKVAVGLTTNDHHHHPYSQAWAGHHHLLPASASHSSESGVSDLCSNSPQSDSGEAPGVPPPKSPVEERSSPVQQKIVPQVPSPLPAALNAIYGPLAALQNAGRPVVGGIDPAISAATTQLLSNLAAVTNGGKGGKNTRPFKAYPRDPMSLPLGLYGLPMAGSNPGDENIMTQASNDAYAEFRRQMLSQVHATKSKRKNSINGNTSGNSRPNSVTGDSDMDMSNGHHNDHDMPETTHIRGTVSVTDLRLVSGNEEDSEHSGNDSVHHAPTKSPPNGFEGVSQHLQHHLQGSSSPMVPSGPTTSTSSTPTTNSNGSGSKKRGRNGEEIKDEAYWERRRKNNEAAKRSRDARRAKEDEIAIRAAFLEQENLKLRFELANLKNETAKLRCMIYNS